MQLLDNLNEWRREGSQLRERVCLIHVWFALPGTSSSYCCFGCHWKPESCLPLIQLRSRLRISSLILLPLCSCVCCFSVTSTPASNHASSRLRHKRQQQRFNNKREVDLLYVWLTSLHTFDLKSEAIIQISCIPGYFGNWLKGKWNKARCKQSPFITAWFVTINNFGLHRVRRSWE